MPKQPIVVAAERKTQPTGVAIEVAASRWPRRRRDTLRLDFDAVPPPDAQLNATRAVLDI
jgi:hypothetical protein